MAKKKILTREAILNAQDIVIEEVFISQWDGYVYVKSLTGRERDKFENDIVEIKGKGRATKAEVKENIRARLVALSVVDPDTKACIFSRADVEAIGNKNGGALDTIYSVAQRLSKLSDEDVEELAENFEKTQDTDSSTS